MSTEAIFTSRFVVAQEELYAPRWFTGVTLGEVEGGCRRCRCRWLTLFIVNVRRITSSSGHRFVFRPKWTHKATICQESD
jgi:hypothetical protein